MKHGIFQDNNEYSTQINLSLIEIEDEILAASTPIGSPTLNQNKVKELITFHESLIGKSSDKIGKMAPKMPRHKTRIDREISKVETCITNSKEAREKKMDKQYINIKLN